MEITSKTDEEVIKKFDVIKTITTDKYKDAHIIKEFNMSGELILLSVNNYLENSISIKDGKIVGPTNVWNTYDEGLRTTIKINDDKSYLVKVDFYNCDNFYGKRLKINFTAEFRFFNPKILCKFKDSIDAKYNEYLDVLVETKESLRLSNIKKNLSDSILNGKHHGK